MIDITYNGKTQEQLKLLYECWEKIGDNYEEGPYKEIIIDEKLLEEVYRGQSKKLTKPFYKYSNKQHYRVITKQQYEQNKINGEIYWKEQEKRKKKVQNKLNKYIEQYGDNREWIKENIGDPCVTDDGNLCNYWRIIKDNYVIRDNKILISQDLYDDIMGLKCEWGELTGQYFLEDVFYYGIKDYMKIYPVDNVENFKSGIYSIMVKETGKSLYVGIAEKNFDKEFEDILNGRYPELYDVIQEMKDKGYTVMLKIGVIKKDDMSMKELFKSYNILLDILDPMIKYVK